MNLTAHKQGIDDGKVKTHNLSEKLSDTQKSLDNAKRHFAEEIQRTHGDSLQKIDANLKYCKETFDHIKLISIKDRNSFHAELGEQCTQLRTEIATEAENVKVFVTNTTNRASAHRENLQEKYDEKLDKIKDVCAQYFSKYEKHLMNQQDIIKNLEKR